MGEFLRERDCFAKIDHTRAGFYNAVLVESLRDKRDTFPLNIQVKVISPISPERAIDWLRHPGRTISPPLNCCTLSSRPAVRPCIAPRRCPAYHCRAGGGRSPRHHFIRILLTAVSAYSRLQIMLMLLTCVVVWWGYSVQDLMQEYFTFCTPAVGAIFRGMCKYK